MFDKAMLLWKDSNYKNGGDLVPCQTPDCQGMGFKDSKTRNKYKCPECKKWQCLSCKTPWHHKMSCEQYQNSLQKEKISTGLDNLQLEGKLQACPKCDAKYEKTYGCDHIKCRNCATHFCYQCGEAGFI